MSKVDSKKRSNREGLSQANQQARFRGRGKDENGVWLNPYRHAMRMDLVFCHFCGFGPPEEPADGICPKCGKNAWEHSVVSRRLIPAKDEE